MRHRGPDEEGVWRSGGIGLGHARLAIIDLEKGQQPMSNEDKTKWIVFNGEIFNYIELREELKGMGRVFRTSSDTEVILYLYEEFGAGCLAKLNGQFAFAIWDEESRELFMARDRFGIEPLYYTRTPKAIIFASEIKAILAYPGVRPKLDIRAIDEIFTFWTTIPPRTIFDGIQELRPGHYLVVKPDSVKDRTYWELDFPPEGEYEKKKDSYYVERLKDLLEDATRLRLRADVGVGAYISGGIDSSSVACLAKGGIGKGLETFSVRFRDRRYDEGPYQRIIIKHLEMENHSIACAAKDIAANFRRVIWHAETPILRTAPAPLYLLSGLARQKGLKIVLVGDGADEFLLGYNIFREVKARLFWAKRKASLKRPLLLKRLYPYLPLARSGDASYLKKIFGRRLEEAGSLYYSHILRWETTSRIKRYFSGDLKSGLGDYNSLAALAEALPAGFRRWDYMARAQYIEASLFLSNYLLSSQGDRMAMAHSVEVRHPFLDHRLVEFANRIPPHVKMRGLNEKFLLKKAMAGLLPEKILKRPKRPFRAPTLKPSRDCAGLLSAKKIKEAGFFEPVFASKLVDKLKTHPNVPVGETDSMAVCGILSLQMVHEIFIKNFKAHEDRYKSRT